MTRAQTIIPIIHYSGKVLFSKRNSYFSNRLSGKWLVSGEKGYYGETDEEAITHGVREETGSEIITFNYLASGIASNPDFPVRWYSCFVDSDKIKPRIDLEEIKWAPKQKAVELCGERVKNLWPKDILQYFTS